MIANAFDAPHVLRPMLGIAWFYGLSTIFVTSFPDYIASVMNYDQNVLIFVLVMCTISILLGSLITMIIGRWKIWRSESIGLVAFGIIGVTLATSLLYFVPSPYFIGEAKGDLEHFLAHAYTPLFMASIILASIFSGIFVVPLQAMAQRRARPETRARLMSAGAVLLNIFVNVTTFALIWLAFQQWPPKTPFLLIIIFSLIISVYALYRVVKPVEYENFVEG